MSLHKCEELHIKLGSGEVLQNVIVGTVKMAWSHVLYDSQMWGHTLKNRMGYILIIKAARNPTRPTVAASKYHGKQRDNANNFCVQAL